MNDSQIIDLLRALGFTLFALYWLPWLLVSAPRDPALLVPSIVVLGGSLVFQLLRRIRTRSALKRLKREFGEKATRPQIILGGDQ